MEQLEAYIATYFGFEDQNLKNLAELFQEESLKKGDVHTRAGQFNSSLSFIKKGYLRVFSIHKGKEITQWISSEGEFITDLSGLMFNQPARWEIQALTDCELFTINTTNYRRVSELIPEWIEMEKMFVAKCFATLEERVFSFLSLSAEERYYQLFNQRKALFNQIPLQYLASMLGMTPETFSRIRKKSIS